MHGTGAQVQQLRVESTMDGSMKEKIETEVTTMLQENKPDFQGNLKKRMAYQRWMMMKLAVEYPEVTMLELIDEIIAPMVHPYQ